MEFARKTWADGSSGGTPITAAELNRIETGVDAAKNELATKVSATVTSPTAGQVLKYNGTTWTNQADATGGGGGGAVDSVNSKTGAVVLNADDISDASTTKKFSTAAEKTKLDGVAVGATANDTDANLKSRANHTGSQSASTISDFTAAVDARVSTVLANSYVQAVIVVTGTEARPVGAVVVLWIETRGESATRPDNVDPVNDLWFTPNGAPFGDVTAPSVPTGLSSSAISSTGFTVSWGASTDNTAVTGYQVRTGTDAPISVSGTSYSFSGLTAATAYAVTVRARDAAGNWSAYSSALNVTTSAGPDTTAPSVPTGLASSAITPTGFTVSWTASTDNVAVTGYEVFIDGVSYATPSGTSQAVTGRSASTAYSVTVRARDAAGNWSAQSSALNVTTTADPMAPISRFNFNEGSGTTATSTDSLRTLTDQTGGSPVWGSGTIKSKVRGYPIGSSGSPLDEWSVALDFTLNALPVSEGTFYAKEEAAATYFNFTTTGAVKVYGVATTTSTATVSTGAPHRLVITQSSTTLKVYLDGTEIISATEYRNYQRTLNTLIYTATLNIDIDTFRVWGIALDSGQVAALGA